MLNTKFLSICIHVTRIVFPKIFAFRTVLFVLLSLMFFHTYSQPKLIIHCISFDPLIDLALWHGFQAISVENINPLASIAFYSPLSIFFLTSFFFFFLYQTLFLFKLWLHLGNNDLKSYTLSLHIFCIDIKCLQFTNHHETPEIFSDKVLSMCIDRLDSVPVNDY